MFLAVDSLHRKVKYFCSVNVWSAGFKIIFGQLAGHQILARFLARFRPVKMLRTSKSLVGIHKAANRDLFISILRIYNCKQLKYFFYDLIVNDEFIFPGHAPHHTAKVCKISGGSLTTRFLHAGIQLT